MPTSDPGQRCLAFSDRWSAVLDGLDDADQAALAREVDQALSVRIRDVRLSGRLRTLYRDASWRQRSRVSRAWLTAAVMLCLPILMIDWLFVSTKTDLPVVVRFGLLPATYMVLLWIWSRPRPDWVEGATLPIAIAAMVFLGGIVGHLGDGTVPIRCIDTALSAAATAIVIFPVRLSWTVVGPVVAIGLYATFGFVNAVSPPSETILYALYATAILGALVPARHTMNVLLEHGFVLNLRSILQGRALAHANARLAVLANTDMLTGLPNRRAFEKAVERLWADPSDPPSSLGIVLFDIDHFKRLNDSVGHARGDQCLAAVAREIQRLVPAGAMCARYGGEEFICLLADATPRGVLRLAEDLRGGIEAMAWPNPGTGRSLTVSVGLALAQTDRRPEGLAALISLADEALYRAKARGRNRVATTWDAQADRTRPEPAQGIA